MKTIPYLFAFTLCLTALATFGQDKTRHLFGEGENVTVGGFGGPMVHFGSVNDEFGVMVGGGGAAIFNSRFFIGGYGQGLTTRHTVTIQQLFGPEDYYLNYGHGGLWLGYIFSPERVLHLTGSLKIGGGGLSFDQYNDNFEDEFNSSALFVLTPQVGAELNIVPFMKLELSVGYQYITGESNTFISYDKISTPLAAFTLKFGSFGEVE